MNEVSIAPEEIACLSTLANGIIPQDERDEGAASVHAGEKLAERIRTRLSSRFYLDGLKTANASAIARFGKEVDQLRPHQVHELLTTLCESEPVFFRQLRADVGSLYLSDPGVWQRIGFPGPSTHLGGYPDFDQPQH